MVTSYLPTLPLFITVYATTYLTTYLTAYLPILLLVITIYATTFFTPINFEASLTVDLTIMLVMTTIFKSIFYIEDDVEKAQETWRGGQVFFYEKKACCSILYRNNYQANDLDKSNTYGDIEEAKGRKQMEESVKAKDF